MGADWSRVLDLDRAVFNLGVESRGAWHVDPWGWPELRFLADKGQDLVTAHLDGDSTFRASAIDVPKENWGSRPAVVLDVLDQLVYQALVDNISVRLIGDMAPEVFGWRLPPKDPKPGHYSKNSWQWEGYRAQLSLNSTARSYGLRSDITSFFASIPMDQMQDCLDDAAGGLVAAKRLHVLLDGFTRTPERSGLPQRSLASSVLANAYLRPLDDELGRLASGHPHSDFWGALATPFARWMDDFWLFSNQEPHTRKAQKDLQGVVRGLGLNLNSAKTDVLEGETLIRSALAIQHSAVDDALASDDIRPLEELVDGLLAQGPHASRSSLRFASTRICQSKLDYKTDEWLDIAWNIPHGADALVPIFTSVYTIGSLQGWFLDYAGSDRAIFEWSVAQYLRMFPNEHKPQKALIEYVQAQVADPTTELPMLALSAERLAVWAPDDARALFSDAMKQTTSPHARRILTLSGLDAGVPRHVARRWLKSEPENAATLAMLDEYGYSPSRARKAAAAKS